MINFSKIRDAVKSAKKSEKTSPEDTLVKKYQDARTGGMKKGLEYGKQYFGAGRSPEELKGLMGDVMSQYQQQAMQGLNSPAFQAMRARALGQMQQQQSQAMQQLQAQQGASGVRGAAGAAQKANLIQSAQMARGDLENQILGQDINVRQQGLQNLQQLVGGQQAGLMGAELGFGGLAAQDISSARQDLLANKYLEQAKAGVASAEAPVDPTWWEKFSKGISSPDAGIGNVPSGAVYAANPYIAAGSAVYNAYKGAGRR